MFSTSSTQKAVHASSKELLVVAADRALYESKHSGRNRVSLPAEIEVDEDIYQLYPEEEPIETLQHS